MSGLYPVVVTVMAMNCCTITGSPAARQGSNDHVDVHVGTGAGARLKQVNREFAIKSA